MAQLFDSIREAVAGGRYVLSVHAVERLRERRIPAWQVAAGIDTAQLILERPDSQPNPSVELEQLLPDGMAVKAVWAWLQFSGLARLVTVHFFDR